MRERVRICRRCSRVGAFNPFRRYASYSPQLTDLSARNLEIRHGLRDGRGPVPIAARPH